MSVPLPVSDLSPYSSSYWSEVEEALVKIQNNPSLELLEQIILNFLNRTKRAGSKYKLDCGSSDVPSCKLLKNLQQVLQSEDGFIENILPSICGVALKMPILFPSKELNILAANTDDKTVFTRHQIACLVAHMFFCTILPCTKLAANYKGHFVGDAAPTGPLTFRYWVTTSTNVTKLYLKSLINYFKDYILLSAEKLETECITFFRKTLHDTEEPKWEESSKKLIKVIPDLVGRIGDEEGHVEMDFANKNVGFGTTGTQEELILGVSPESCPVVLFTETLKKEDALLIQGMKKYGNFSGYSATARYTGFPEEQWNWSNRKILAMDALWAVGDDPVQLQSENLKRELNKAFCAFSMVPGTIIDTGHWGCGAFGGNKGIKALLQIMAASEAQVETLKFFSFKDKEFNFHFDLVVKALKEKDVTVGQLWKYLKDYAKKKAPGVDHLAVLKWLQKTLK